MTPTKKLFQNGLIIGAAALAIAAIQPVVAEDAECGLRLQAIQSELDQTPDNVELQAQVDEAAVACEQGNAEEADRILTEVVERLSDTVTQ